MVCRESLHKHVRGNRVQCITRQQCSWLALAYGNISELQPTMNGSIISHHYCSLIGNTLQYSHYLFKVLAWTNHNMQFSGIFMFIIQTKAEFQISLVGWAITENQQTILCFLICCFNFQLLLKYSSTFLISSAKLDHSNNEHLPGRQEEKLQIL